MSCWIGRAVVRGMKTRKVLRAHGGFVDRAEYGLMAADGAHIADERGRGRLILVVDGRRDELGDRYTADLVSLALRKTNRREDGLALRELMRWLGDCEPTWRSEPKVVVVQRQIRGHESLCSLLVHLEEDESLRYGILMVEVLPSVRQTRWQECCHFDSRFALAEAVIVHDKVQPRAAER